MASPYYINWGLPISPSYRVAPMDRYIVIGNPVSHSLSPEIHARFAASLDERIEYGKLLVPAGEFAPHAQRFFDEGGHGANVTLPFKVDAFGFAQSSSARARAAGAANFLARRSGAIHADNTDGAGLVADLTRNLALELRGARIVVLGAGGAARGVLGPLLALAPAAIEIANRTAGNAVELARAFAPMGPVRALDWGALDHATPALVINATSASVHGEPLEIPARLLGPGVFAYDMAYGPAADAFLEKARLSGARAVSDGLGMLVEQAAESYFLWRGRRPQTQAVLAQLRQRPA